MSTVQVRVSPERDESLRSVAEKLNGLAAYLPIEVFDVHLGALINPVYNPEQNGPDITFFTKYLTCYYSFDPELNYHCGWGSDDTEDFRIRVSHRPITIGDEHFRGGQTVYWSDMIDGVSYITNFHDGETLYGRKRWEDFDRKYPPQLRIRNGEICLFRRNLCELAERNAKGGIHQLDFFCDILRIINPEIFPFRLYHEYTIETEDSWEESLPSIPKKVTVHHTENVILGPVDIHNIPWGDRPIEGIAAKDIAAYLDGYKLFDMDNEECSRSSKKHRYHHG